jgi:hypothetical protein
MNSENLQKTKLTHKNTICGLAEWLKSYSIFLASMRSHVQTPGPQQQQQKIAFVYTDSEQSEKEVKKTILWHSE